MNPIVNMFYRSKRKTFVISQLRSDTISAPTNAAVKLVIVKPFNIVLRYQNISPFTASEKKPRVRIFRGRVNILITGFRNMLNSVRHAPTTAATHTGFTLIPGITRVVPHTATDRIIQCKIIRILKNIIN